MADGASPVGIEFAPLGGRSPEPLAADPSVTFAQSPLGDAKREQHPNSHHGDTKDAAKDPDPRPAARGEKPSETGTQSVDSRIRSTVYITRTLEERVRSLESTVYDDLRTQLSDLKAELLRELGVGRAAGDAGLQQWRAATLFCVVGVMTGVLMFALIVFGTPASHSSLSCSTPQGFTLDDYIECDNALYQNATAAEVLCSGSRFIMVLSVEAGWKAVAVIVTSLTVPFQGHPPWSVDASPNVHTDWRAFLPLVPLVLVAVSFVSLGSSGLGLDECSSSQFVYPIDRYEVRFCMQSLPHPRASHSSTDSRMHALTVLRLALVFLTLLSKFSYWPPFWRPNRDGLSSASPGANFVT